MPVLVTALAVVLLVSFPGMAVEGNGAIALPKRDELPNETNLEVERITLIQ